MLWLALFAAPELYECYERQYDAAHLQKHQSQVVQRIRTLRFAPGRVAVDVWLRDGAGPFSVQDAACVQRGGKLECDRQGESSGSFSLAPKKDGALLRLSKMSFYGKSKAVWVPKDVYRLGSNCGPREGIAYLGGECSLGGCLRFLMRFDWKDLEDPSHGERLQSQGGIARVLTRARPKKRAKPWVFYVPVEMNTCMQASFLSVWVSGFRRGAAILQSQQGVLELVSQRVQVGAKDNLRIYEKKSLRQVGKYPTPASATVGADFSVSYSPKGEGLIKQGRRCVAVKADGAFEARPFSQCKKTEPYSLDKASQKKLGIKAGERVEHIKGSRFFAVYRMDVVC